MAVCDLSLAGLKNQNNIISACMLQQVLLLLKIITLLLFCNEIANILNTKIAGYNSTLT